MVGEWIPDNTKPGHFGGPSLATKHSKSLVVNHHITVKDERDVSSNYKHRPYSNDSYCTHLNSEVKVSNPGPKLSKNQRRKMHRYGADGYKPNPKLTKNPS